MMIPTTTPSAVVGPTTVQFPLRLSWIGSSCLCPKDAERELIALKGKPMLRKDSGALKATPPSRARRTSGGACPWRPPSTSSATTGGVRPQFHPSSLGRFTSDQAILAFQEEAEALHQALLADKSDYRLAQCSMSRMDVLEGVLWEAHSAEARAAARLETRELEQAQRAERGALEADMDRKRDRLGEACRRQACLVRQEHEAQLAELVAGRTARSDGRELVSTTPAGPPAPADVAVNTVPLTTTDGGPQRKGTNNSSSSVRASQGDGVAAQQLASAPQMAPVAAVTAVAAAAAAAAADRVRGKEMVELRVELARHLAVAHADGGRHVQEAARVMRLMEELGERARLEMEVNARSAPGGLEKAILQQKHLQMEEVQRDKHDKLLRALERSRAEELRLLSARHRGALGRLAERLREKNRRRKQELRERLAGAKNGVARAWREHSRCLLGAGGKVSQSRVARERCAPLEQRVEAAEAAASLSLSERAAAAASTSEEVALSARREQRCDHGLAGGNPRVYEDAAAASTVGGKHDALLHNTESAPENVGDENTASPSGQREPQEQQQQRQQHASGKSMLSVHASDGGCERDTTGAGDDGRGGTTAADDGLSLLGGSRDRDNTGAKDVIQASAFALLHSSGGAEDGVGSERPRVSSGCQQTSAACGNEAEALSPTEGTNRGPVLADAQAAAVGGGVATRSDPAGAHSGATASDDNGTTQPRETSTSECGGEEDACVGTGGVTTTTTTTATTNGKPRTKFRVSFATPSSPSSFSAATAPATDGKGGIGTPGKTRKKRATVVAAEGAVEDPAPTAGLGRAVSVLSEEEAQILAALGRGAPNDPRLLLLTAPPPPKAWDAAFLEENGDASPARDDGRNSNNRGIGRGVGGVGGGGDSLGRFEEVEHSSRLLERAVDKLVSKMQTEEELTRRRFGMAPLSSLR